MGRTKCSGKRKAAEGDDMQTVRDVRLRVATSLAAHHAALVVSAAGAAGAAAAAAQDEEAGDPLAGSKAPGKKMLYSQALERALASEAAALSDVEALSFELTRASAGGAPAARGWSGRRVCGGAGAGA
jgi:hypothetical protein